MSTRAPSHSCLSLMLAVWTLCACDSSEGKAEPQAADGAVAGGASEADAEKAKPAKSEKTQAEPQKVKEWKMTYSGALSGEIGGSRIVVVFTGASSAIRARAGDARLNFSLSKNPRTDPPEFNVLPLTATLTDGTKCQMSNVPNVEVKAYEKDDLDVSLSGEMKCGEGQKVNYEASVRKKG